MFSTSDLTLMLFAGYLLVVAVAYASASRTRNTRKRH